MPPRRKRRRPLLTEGGYREGYSVKSGRWNENHAGGFVQK